MENSKSNRKTAGQGGAGHGSKFWAGRRYKRGVALTCAQVLCILAIARVLHSVGAKVILAGRNVQKLQQVKFTLDAETPGNVS